MGAACRSVYSILGAVTPTCRRGRSARASVSYLVPIFALIQAVVIFGEHPAPLEIVGGAIMLCGVRVATLRFKPETALEEAAPA